MLKYHGRGGSGECSESLLTGSMAAVDKRCNQLLNFSSDLLRCRVTNPIGKKQRGVVLSRAKEKRGWVVYFNASDGISYCAAKLYTFDRLSIDLR